MDATEQPKKQGIKDAFDPKSQSSGHNSKIKIRNIKTAEPRRKANKEPIKNPEGDGMPAAPKLHLVRKI